MQEVAHEPVPSRPVVSVVGAVVGADAVRVSGGVPAEDAETHDAYTISTPFMSLRGCRLQNGFIAIELLVRLVAGLPLEVEPRFRAGVRRSEIGRASCRERV